MADCVVLVFPWQPIQRLPEFGLIGFRRLRPAVLRGGSCLEPAGLEFEAASGSRASVDTRTWSAD